MEKNVNNNWLGTCRGIAAVGVVLTHLLPQIDAALSLNSPIIGAITVDYIDTGKIGVALLFLIAGYLTSSSKRKRNVRQFAVNRFFRLYPLYWLDIALVGVLFAFDHYGWDTIAANMTMLQVFLRKEDLVGLFWTLPIELLLYVGGVLLEKYMWDYRKLEKIIVICCVGTVVIAIVRKTVWNSAPVAIGLLLSTGLLGQTYRLVKEKIASKLQLGRALAIFELTLIVSSLLAYQNDIGHQENWYRYVLSYSIAILIFTIFMWTGKSYRLFTSIAAIAYPLYLLQEIVFRVAFEKIWFPEINVPIFIVGTLTALILVSFGAHEFIEKPMVSIGNKIEKKI